MNRLVIIDDPGGLNEAVRELGLRRTLFISFQRHLDPSIPKPNLSVDVTWVDPITFFSSVNKGFREDYTEWMGSLNQKNLSVFWAQLDLAGKSALSTRLCQRVFYMVCLQRLIEAGQNDIVVCFSDDIVVRQAVKNLRGLKIVDCRRKKTPLHKLFFELLPGKMIYRFLLILGRKCVAGRSVIPKDDRSLVVIKTTLSRDSFDCRGKYRDVYFGQLVDYIKEKRSNFIVVGIVLNSYRFCIKQIRHCGLVNLYSLEQTISLLDIGKCLLKSLWSIINGTVYRVKTMGFRGCEVGRIVRESVKEEMWSGRLLFNDMNARSTENLLDENEVERFIYPFENRGWERADLMAIRSRGQRTQAVGYQHSAITQKHTEYYRASEDPLPLPDRIISMGEITAKLLVENGFPVSRVKSGPAFRQCGTFVQPQRRRATPLRILILLSTSVDYYRRTLSVLSNIFPPQGEYELRVRAHPLIPLNNNLLSGFPFPVTIDRARTCEDAIEESDVIIYSSSSTVALNCLQRGKPVFYVPVDDFLDADPLFELTACKWVLRTNKDLIQAISEWQSMNEKDWRSRLAEAQAYVARYFGPVKEMSMDQFIQ